MPESDLAVRWVRFAEFELDLHTGELRKRSEKVNLQGQPSQVMVLLVQRAPEMVSRDELKKKLWPEETFGDFEAGLNKAIQKIRIALGDSADSPRFVETLQRRGYRFIERVAPLASTARAKKIRLAVLPFKNLIADPGQEFLNYGLTEEMIAHIGMISPLEIGVIAATSVMKYRNTEKDVVEIGRELIVDYLVEGSVQRDGDRIRISARLIQVSDQICLWAGNFERSLPDIFTLQTEVARSIAEALKVELLPDQGRRAAGPSAEAYELYLRGRYFWNKRTEGDLNKAIDCFNRALEDEPGYAQAYAGVADCYSMLGWNSMLPPDVALPKARSAAVKALKLNDRLAEAHASLAFCKMFHEWDWVGAEREFKRALELNPSYPAARPWYAFLMSASGRHTEAIKEVHRALQLDPFSRPIGASAGLVLSLAGQHDKAIQQCLRTLEMDDTGFYQTYFVLGASYAAKGMFQEAVESLETAVARSNGNPHMIAALGNALAVGGRTTDARKLVGELRKREGTRHVSPLNLAMVYTGLGDKDEAFEWLEKAYESRSLWLIFLNVHPMFEELRSDSRFKSLVRRMGLGGTEEFFAGPAGERSPAASASNKNVLRD